MASENISNGLKMEIKPASATSNAGTLPNVSVIITNISQQPIIFCKYQLKHRMLCTMMAGEFEMHPFVPTPPTPVGEGDFVTLPPGGTIQENLDLAKEKDYHFVVAAHLPKVVPDTMAVTEFPAGDYTLKCHTGEHISFYSAPAGSYNHVRERLNILDALVKPGLAVDPSKAWRGDMIAECPIKFS